MSKIFWLNCQKYFDSKLDNFEVTLTLSWYWKRQKIMNSQTMGSLLPLSIHIAASPKLQAYFSLLLKKSQEVNFTNSSPSLTNTSTKLLGKFGHSEVLTQKSKSLWPIFNRILNYLKQMRFPKGFHPNLQLHQVVSWGT